MKKGLTTAIIAVAGIGGAYAGSKLVSSYMQDRNLVALEEGQALAAKQLRSQLPMKVDEATTLQSVISMGPALAYHYVIDANKADLDIESFKELMQVQLKANTCEHEGMAETIKYGGEYIYMYMSADNLRLGEFKFGKKECGFA